MAVMFMSGAEKKSKLFGSVFVNLLGDTVESSKKYVKLSFLFILYNNHFSCLASYCFGSKCECYVIFLNPLIPYLLFRLENYS